MDDKLFHYTEKDFIQNNEEHDTQFDATLCKLWDKTMNEGIFRYNLMDVERKVLDGAYKIIAQLNAKRFSERRTPQAATNVMMPFDPTKFNFNKIKDNEVLLDLKNDTKSESGQTDRIVINVSPIEYGHILLVPDCLAMLPQVMTIHGIRVATEVMLLSSKRGFCMGFNSLCALASVNHLHLHAFYIDHNPPILQANVSSLNKWLYKTEEYLVNSLAIQLQQTDVESFARRIVGITKYLSENEIAHNLFICRRKNFDNNEMNTVTCFIFPKKKSPGVKETRYLNSCCFDLAGYLLIKDKSEYDGMHENEAIRILRKYTFQDDEFNELCTTLLTSTGMN